MNTPTIASERFPQCVWLATGCIHNLNEEKCAVLKGRRVVLFPDLKAYDKWAEKTKGIPSLVNYSISRLLEEKASDEERKEGYDLADYLLGSEYGRSLKE